MQYIYCENTFCECFAKSILFVSNYNYLRVIFPDQGNKRHFKNAHFMFELKM